jgi:hypothetical protein
MRFNQKAEIEGGQLRQSRRRAVWLAFICDGCNDIPIGPQGHSWNLSCKYSCDMNTWCPNICMNLITLSVVPHVIMPNLAVPKSMLAFIKEAPFIHRGLWYDYRPARVLYESPYWQVFFWKINKLKLSSSFFTCRLISQLSRNISRNDTANLDEAWYEYHEWFGTILVCTSLCFVNTMRHFNESLN